MLLFLEQIPVFTKEESENYKRFVMQKLEERKGNEDTGENHGICLICNSQPRNSSFGHGIIAHIVSCYPCSVKIAAAYGNRCPVCNRSCTVMKHFAL